MMNDGQAKGLEFSHVWLVRFSDSVCPLPVRQKVAPNANP